jgi:hypothetical protein
MATTSYYSPYGGALLTGSAPVAFTSGTTGGQVDSNLTIEWDFDHDGDFDQSVENITSDVLAAQVAYGRDFPSSLTGRSGPGQLKLTLRNEDDRYSYFNAASPLNASPFSLRTGRKIRVRANDAVTGAASISYVGIGTAQNGSNTSLVPGLPTGLLSATTSTDGNADLMVIVASIRNSGTGTVVAPNGWTKMVETGNVAVLARFYHDGDTAPTVTFSGGVANATTLAQCFAFRGTHQTLSRAFVNSTSQLNASAQNIAVPGLVASATSWMTDPDTVATVVIGWKQDDWTSVAQLSGQFLTEISDTPTTTGDDAGLEIQYRLGGFSGAKTFSATSLVVTGGASAISRAVVFQLAPAVARTEPVLLAWDNFERATGNFLGSADVGGTWTARSGGGFGIRNTGWAGGQATARTGYAAQYNTAIISTVDTGRTDHYVQVLMSIRVQDGDVGLVFRYVDSNNYARMYYNNSDRGITVQEVKAGVVSTILTAWQIESWDGMTLGVGVENQDVTVYVGGQPLETEVPVQLTNTITGTHAGLYAKWQSHSDTPPLMTDFRVWDQVAKARDGIIWTGWVRSVKPSVTAGPMKLVEVEAAGPLAGMAGVEVAAPRIVREVGETEGDNHSVPAGCIVGDLISRAGLLNPPYPLPTYPTSHIGNVSFKDGKALELARMIELAERGPNGSGWLKETPEGYITFEDREYRATLPGTGWWSDASGTGQFHYEAIEPLDHEGQIVNRAIAQAAPQCPTVVDVSNQSDDDASTLDVSIIVPNVSTGQLVLVFIACSSVQDSRQWLNPPGWTSHRDVGDDIGIRIYSLVADGSESGTQVYFLKTEQQGTFIAHIYVIDHWFGTDDGIKVGRVSSGAVYGQNAYPVSPGWNRAPALYIVFQGAIGANSGILWGDLAAPPPLGYDYNSLEGLVVVTSPVSFETGVESIYKTDITDTEDPGPWLGVFTDYVLLETVCVAIRGYNGPLSKPSLEDSKAVGGEGIIFQIDDADSQSEHAFIRSNPDIPTLLYADYDARVWDECVIAQFSDDRPIVTISFTASKNALLRSQAIRRRTSDKVTISASGRSGLGISGEFHIEHVHHAWSNGTKQWVTTWECSPV